ncbi:hypothetical protein [Nocardioides immobilis]|nr:hypothetical protein [Nocardioides immobilis]
MKSPPADAGGVVGRLRTWPAHPLAVPFLLAIVMLAIGAQAACLYDHPNPANDEPAHIGYVAALARGDLPTIDTSSGYDGSDEAHSHVWTANHPPAFHALLVPIWWLSSGDAGAATIAMRLVNTAGFAGWLFLVGLIARELVPRRRWVPAVATAVALTPTLAIRSGFVMNDGLGSAAALLAMLMTIRMVRRQVTPMRVAVAAIAGTLAAGTRAQGVLLVALCCLVVLIVGVRQHGWVRGSAAAAVVGGVPAVATGWFYLRNYRLYGDFTGQDALLDKFARSPIDHVFDVFALRTVIESLLSTPIPLLALTVLTPIAAIAAARRGDLRPDLAWLLLGTNGAITAANIAHFISAGGGFHDRYFMQVMPLLATATALGMLEVARWIPRSSAGDLREGLVATCWTAVLLGWLAGAVAVLEWFDLVAHPNRIPVAGATPIVLAAAAGLTALAAVAVMVRGDRRPSEGQLSAEPALYSDQSMFQSP